MSSKPASRRPMLIVLSAPSGGGKTTLCRRLLKERGDLVYSVSCTTRAPRGGEVNGREYFFLGEKEFDARVREGRFLEHARVHGHRYGTLKETVEKALRAGKSVVMAIDVQGARQIRERVRSLPAGDPLKGRLVDVFVAPPSLEVLRERLEKRGEDSPETMARRLKNAEAEMNSLPEFQFAIVNDELEEALKRLKDILDHEAERQET